MNAFDYYDNPEITEYLHGELRYIGNCADREDCRQEVFASLYDEMPLDIKTARQLVKRVCEKFKRDCNKIAFCEACGYEDEH